MNPQWYPFLVVATVTVIVLIVRFLLVREDPYPYEKCAVMTEAEQQFLRALGPCVPPGTMLMGKVRLADFLRVKATGKSFMRHFGRISQKHADFLLVDAETAEPLLVIELDDSSHRRLQRTMESDAFKDAAFAAARLPILRVRTAKRYPTAELKAAICEAMGEG